MNNKIKIFISKDKKSYIIYGESSWFEPLDLNDFKRIFESDSNLIKIISLDLNFLSEQVIDYLILRLIEGKILNYKLIIHDTNNDSKEYLNERLKVINTFKDLESTLIKIKNNDSK